MATHTKEKVVETIIEIYIEENNKDFSAEIIIYAQKASSIDVLICICLPYFRLCLGFLNGHGYISVQNSSGHDKR